MKKIISSKIPISTTILPLQQLFFTGKMHMTTTEQKLNNPFLCEFIQTLGCRLCAIKTLLQITQQNKHQFNL
jgi:hypothetical protein